MADFLIYDLKVAALIAAFYFCYRLLMERDTWHRTNRVVLLSGLALSLVLPLCVITLHETVWIAPEGPLPSTEHDAMTIPSETEAGAFEIDWQRLLAITVVAGMAVRLFFIVNSFGQLQRLLRNSERHVLADGTVVAVTDEPVASFSWMQTVVMSRNDYEEQNPLLLIHERSHIRLHHSWDVVFVELLTVLQWFNPVVWLLSRDLRTVHEFEADEAVLSQGFNTAQYISLLMTKATGIQACALANGINTSEIKKRIDMMIKRKSPRLSWLKGLYVVPIAALSLAMTAKTVTDYRTLPTTAEEKPTEDNTPRKTTVMSDKEFITYVSDRKKAGATQSQLEREILSEGKGISRARILHLNQTYGVERHKDRLIVVDGKKLSQEEFEKMNLAKDNIDRVDVLDVGSAKKVYGERGRYGATVIQTTPPPGTYVGVVVIDGKIATKEEYNALLKNKAVSYDKRKMSSEEAQKKYGARGKNGAWIITTKPVTAKKQGAESVGDIVFDICEEMPRFPGGDAELMKFLAKNVKYPEVATEWDVQGRVIVKFVIEKDGRVTSAQVAKTTDLGEPSDIAVTAYSKDMTEEQRKEAEAQDAGIKAGAQAIKDEAVRVVNLMPKWQPGKQNGSAVRCYYSIPVTFRLQ